MTGEGGLLRGWKLDLREAEVANGFDALRLAAAACVLAGQAWTLTGRKPEPWPGGWDTLGGIGVAIFFVISGFLVASSRERSATIATFLHKRALRLLPALALVCFVSVFVLGAALTTLPVVSYLEHSQTRAYFANLTLLDVQPALPGVFADNPVPQVVNGALWTLPIGAFLWLLVGLGGAQLLERWRMLAVAIAALAAFQWFGPRWASSGAQLWVTLPVYHTVKYGAFFALGAAAYAWRDRVPFSPVAAALLWAAAWLLSATPWALLAYMPALAYTVLLVAALPLAPLAGVGRWGDFSYGLYLFAFPVQQVLVRFGAAGWPLAADIAACFAIALALAALSWHWIEKPALGLKSGAHLR